MNGIHGLTSHVVFLILLTASLTRLAPACPLADECVCHNVTGTVVSSVTCRNLGDLRHLPSFTNIPQTIQVLQIDGADANRIHTVSNQTFSGLKIVSLKMVNLGISTIEPVAFNGLEDDLVELNLSGNALDQLQAMTLWRLTHLRILDLSANNLTRLSEVTFQNLKTLNYLDLSTNMINSLNVSLFSELRNLSYLDLSHNMIAEFHKDSFINLVSLEYLHISHNHLTRLHSKSFMGQRSLRGLYLHNNNLVSLTIGMLDTLRRLHELDLSRNHLAGFERERPFVSLNELLYLDLSDNEMAIIPHELFLVQRALTDLKLANNRIKSIESDSFDNLINLRLLDLDSNWLTGLGGKLFKKNALLSELRLSNNPLQGLSMDTFEGLEARTNLTHLFLNNTCLSIIDAGTFTPISGSLQKLYLQHSPLDGLHGGAFSRLLHLSTLNLAFTSITDDTLGSLPRLNGLRHLNLSGCEISNVSGLLSSVDRLESLDLTWANLFHLGGSYFSQFSRPFRLYLGHAHLECDCDLWWLRSFSQLADPLVTMCKVQGVDSTHKLAVCFDRPPSCDAEPSAQVHVACSNTTNPMWIEHPPPEPGVNPSVCQLDQYNITTMAPVTPTLQPVSVEVEFQGNNITVWWATSLDQPHQVLVSIADVNFMARTTTHLDGALTHYTWYNLDINKVYNICVTSELKEDIDTIRSLMKCTLAGNLNVTLRPTSTTIRAQTATTMTTTSTTMTTTSTTMTTTSAPPPTNLDKVALIVIACLMGAVALLVTVIVIIYFVRRRKDPIEEEKKHTPDSDSQGRSTIRQQAAMWVRRFTHPDHSGEDMAEQSTLTWDLVSTVDQRNDRLTLRNPKLAHTKESQMESVPEDEQEDRTSC